MKNKSLTSEDSIKKQQAPRTLFEKTDSFFAKYEWIWFFILLGITFLTSILLYDPRVSPGGDDSAYIVMARDFLKEFRFTDYQGPLYPVILSVVYAFFGMSLKAFKVFSMMSMLACMYLMFMAFRKRIPQTLLFIMLLLTSFNSHVLYFASQTYNEAFFMFMQSLLILVFFRFFILREEVHQSAGISVELKKYLLPAVVLFGCILTRSIGISLFLGATGYFILYGQWKKILWLTAGILICLAGYQLLKYFLWNDVSFQASSQGNSLLNKDFYRPESGRETLSGFVIRFWTNSNQYISRFFMVMLGLRETFTPEGFYVETKPWITVLVYLLGLTGLCFSYKRNKYLFFSGIVTGTFLVVTFVVMQIVWSQYRLIVPVYPLMILLLFSGIYYILSLPGLRPFQFLLLVPVVIICFGMLTDTSEASEKAGKLKNEYSGLTPDWLNYTKAAAWVAKNLPDDALAACRKPSISTIYGQGKKFFGIFRVNSGSFDAFYERWKADSLMYSIVPLEGMDNQMYGALLGQCEARISLVDKYFFVVKDRDFLQQLSMYFENFRIISTPYEFSPMVKQAGEQTAIYYSDSLLIPMRQANVTHLITAQLRLNPNIKNGQIINTVERVATFIQDKYPDIFHRLIQIGAPDDEPAEVYQINWDVVKD